MVSEIKHTYRQTKVQAKNTNSKTKINRGCVAGKQAGKHRVSAAGIHTYIQHGWHTGRQLGRQAHRHAGRKAGSRRAYMHTYREKKAERQAGRQAGRDAGR